MPENNQQTEVFPGGIFFFDLDEDAREIYIVDAKRVLVYDYEGKFKRGWGAASALVLGSGVAYALFGINPVKSYPYVLGMAWPAIGANVMRQIALAGTGHGRMTVLGRGRW